MENKNPIEEAKLLQSIEANDKLETIGKNTEASLLVQDETKEAIKDLQTPLDAMVINTDRMVEEMKSKEDASKIKKDRIRKIKDLSKALEDDIVSSDDILNFLDVVISSIKDNREEIKNQFENQTKENLSKLKKITDEIQSRYDDIISKNENISESLNDIKEDFIQKISEIKDSISENETLIKKFDLLDSKIENSKKETKFYIDESISKIKTKKGDKGEKGKDGSDGKNGSPDTPEEIAEKLNTLTKIIDFKVIKNFPDISKNNGGNGIGYLREASDVSITNPTNGQVLKYNTTTGVWENGTDNAGSVTSFSFSNGNGFTGTVTNASTTPQLSLTTSLTLGSIPFIGASGALSQDNANFFWDDTNNRLGVGTASPQTALDIRGSGDLLTLYNGSNGGFILSASVNLGGMSSASSLTGLGFGINGATDSIFIKTNKYVGIRESNPTAYLQITGQTLYDYLLRVKNTTGDTMLEIRSDMNNSEGILSKYGYMTTQSGKFEVAGAGTIMRGSGLLLYSSSIIQADYYGGGGTLIANFLTDSSKYYANAGAVPSAVLEVYSTTQGFLMPRMTTTQKNAISTPAEGLMVYDNQILSPYFYSNSTWKQISETYSDTYTPTLTNGTNVSSSTAYVCTYIRVGNAVTVSGEVEVTVSGANAQTLLGISLPISSDFANSTECGGVGSTQGNSTAADTGSIHADTANDIAELDFFDTRGASSIISFTFTYQII